MVVVARYVVVVARYVVVVARYDEVLMRIKGRIVGNGQQKIPDQQIAVFAVPEICFSRLGANAFRMERSKQD